MTDLEIMVASGAYQLSGVQCAADFIWLCLITGQTPDGEAWPDR